MNIYTVKTNLERTIANKQALLKDYDKRALKAEDNATMAAAFATIGFLKINIEELQAILKDVEVCCKQATEASWRNDDRQGGI